MTFNPVATSDKVQRTIYPRVHSHSPKRDVCPSDTRIDRNSFSTDENPEVMTDDQIEQIEIHLSINLPDAYIDFMNRDFPAEFDNNRDSDLWDCSSSIITRNLELRDDKFFTPWPDDLFFIGDPLTACANAIRLTDEECLVYWLDHCDARKIGNGKPFTGWAGMVLENYFL